MVDAAWRQLPGVSNRQRIRAAVEAAVALVPDPERPIEVPVTARIHLQVDQEQLHAETVAALERWRAGYDSDEQGRMVLATYDAAIHTDEPHVTVDGLEGPGVTDATGQSAITVNEPRVLAGVSEIAARLQVGRSTVAGWIKNRDDNGMPEPVTTLAAGPVYDLDTVLAWHAKWKGR